MPAMVLWMSFWEADQLIHQFKRSRLHADSVAITRQLLLHLSSCAAAGNAMTDIPRFARIQNMMFSCVQ